MKTIRFGSVAEFRNGVNYDADGAEACAKVIGVGDFGSLSRLSNFLHIGEIRLSSPLSDQDCLVLMATCCLFDQTAVKSWLDDAC